jgi:crotonobetainyl-CoA:carnitine CoA-transferase CaiB-like acyl-CoA transferase
MDAPLSGIKVVELAMWVAGPATTAILGDWGADVIKLEEPNGGDPIRAMTTKAMGDPNVQVRPPYELDNRNKRSVAVNLRKREGREFAIRLLERSDVFVTNLRLDALERMGLDYASLAARNPRLVYATLNGYGHRGPERLRGAFDYAAAWARSGLMATIAEPGQAPPAQRPGMIDHAAGLGLAGAISAALLSRERSGKGQEVRISLFEMGLWMNAIDLTVALMSGSVPQPESRLERVNPLWNCYKCRDHKWIYFVMIQIDRHWKDFCAALAQPEWLNDPRFANSLAIAKHAREMTSAIDEVIGARDRSEWAEAFDRHHLFWAPVQTDEEVIVDPQAIAIGAFPEIDHPHVKHLRLVRGPVEFGATKVGPRSSAPELGQHTEEVALEAGLSWEEIASLKELGALG